MALHESITFLDIDGNQFDLIAEQGPHGQSMALEVGGVNLTRRQPAHRLSPVGFGFVGLLWAVT